MSTTAINPGSFKQMSIKNVKAIASNFVRKTMKFRVLEAVNGLISDSKNLIDKKKITSKKGKYFCSICNNRSESFYHMSNAFRFSWNSACFHCSSRGRHRGLFYLYSELVENLDSTKKILHFAPEPVFYPIFKEKKFTYQTTDYFLEDVDFPKIDVQKINMPDNQFDIILSNHVIEHVADDLSALKETFRILKTGGKFILTVPGNYNKYSTVYFKDLSNNGHYRDYGMDFLEKFGSVFKNAKCFDLSKYNEKHGLGIQKNEMVFIGEK